ncbi:hypothetical protein BCR44DRAFT_1424044 [Catenaria anguillulae PL171]|uniref:NDT80 domain-containing protein n=1 Tax=Catenaria anguillulae PL171 TaxID=765915 RepID=A0A1Y2I4L3_9FUNG|nr:hypothetical protein BCR44DRAFT_1424044 [Catenaria anguillulae PL171]
MLRHPSQALSSHAPAAGASNSPSPLTADYASLSMNTRAIAASAESAAPSSLLDAPLPPRNRARSSRTKWENLPGVGGGPRFTSEQIVQVQDVATKRQVIFEVKAKMDKGFHFGTTCNHYCCFKRNLSEISACYFAMLQPTGNSAAADNDTSILDTHALSAIQVLRYLSASHPPSAANWVQCSDLRLSVRCVASNGEAVALVQRSPKRDKGPTYPVLPKRCQPKRLLDSPESSNMAVWERIQFTKATPAQYGPSSARKRAKPMATYKMIVELIAQPVSRSTASSGNTSGVAEDSVGVDDSIDIVIAKATSDPFIVRSRSPGQYGGAAVAASGGSYARMSDHRRCLAGSASHGSHGSPLPDYDQTHRVSLLPELPHLPFSAPGPLPRLSDNHTNPRPHPSPRFNPPIEPMSGEYHQEHVHLRPHRLPLGVNPDRGPGVAARDDSIHWQHDGSAVRLEGIRQRHSPQDPSLAHVASDHHQYHPHPYPGPGSFLSSDRPYSYPAYPTRNPPGPPPIYDPYNSSPRSCSSQKGPRLEPAQPAPYAYGFARDGPYDAPDDPISRDRRGLPPIYPMHQDPYSTYRYPPLPTGAHSACARPPPPPPPHSFQGGYYAHPAGYGGYGNDGFFPQPSHHFSRPPTRFGGHFGSGYSRPAPYLDSDVGQHLGYLARRPVAAPRSDSAMESGGRDAREHY